MTTYQARYFDHKCSDGDCGGEVLETYRSGTRKVRRIALELLPGKSKLFDTIADAEAWAAQRDATVVMNG